MASIVTVASAAQLYCLFRRGELDFALPGTAVRGAVAMKPLTPVPFGPADLCGVFLDRRDVVPVVLLDRWLGLTAAPRSASGPWLLIDDGSATLAAVVDRVLGVASFAPTALKPTHAHPLATGTVAYESRTVVVLDAARLIVTVNRSLLAAMPQAVHAA